MKKIVSLALVSWLFSSTLFAQNSNFRPHFGSQFGLSFSLGTHVQRVGLILRAYYAHDFLQANFQTAAYYSFGSLATRAKGWETQLQFGLTGAWGKRDSFLDLHPYQNPVANQTARPFSLGYAYIFYFDQFKTSQQSGLFGFQIRNFRLAMENDFLAFQSFDQFRTGAISLAYRVKDWQFSFQHIAFTGNPYSRHCPWIEEDKFPSKSGYIDMDQAPYGNCSAGVAALQVEYRVPVNNYLSKDPIYPYDQVIGLGVGIDSEWIRNFFQNKLIHDSALIPINWGNVKNPHIPMVCKDGCSYLYQEGQEVRPAKLYLQGLLNNVLLY